MTQLQVQVDPGAAGPDLKPFTVPVREPVRIWHLLTHTAGLTYGFHRVHPSDAALRAAGYEWSFPDGACPPTPSAPPSPAPRPCSPAGPASSRPCTTTTGSSRCSAAADSSTAS